MVKRVIKNLNLIMLLLFCLSTPLLANMVTNYGFETDEETYKYGFPGLPNTYGDWAGDYSDIVGTENSIAAHEGSSMLKLIYTGNGPDAFLNTSEVWQYIDVSAYQTAIGNGVATANASGWFNRVFGDSQTDTSMGLTIYAYSGSISSKALITSVSGGIATDGNIQTWEKAVASLLLPTNTAFLGIRIYASENIFNDGSAPELDGHYADLISLDISTGSSAVPEPSTMILLFAGLIGIAGFGRKNG